MTIKVLSEEEYQKLLEQAKEEIVSELEMIVATHSIVVVKYDEDHYKVLKYPRVASQIYEDAFEKLGTMVSKEEIEKFVFLQNL